MDYGKEKKRLVYHALWGLLLAIGWLWICPSQAQTPKGHRLPNVAVGIHHHHPDSTLCPR